MTDDKPSTVSVSVCENEMYNSQLQFLKTEIHQSNHERGTTFTVNIH